MNIEKARVSVQKDTFSVEVGLTKIDEEKRLVSGFATLDNLDLQGDIVDFDASVRAFERSRKNVREMHQPIAVGKIVDWKPQEFVDADGTVYKGIYTSVYVSRGAQDTWEKVLDGTLSAFSISGPVNKSVSEMRKGSTKPVKRILDYDLNELSLVDSGGNQLANVFTIQKSAEGVATEVSGIATDVSVDEVLWCENDEMAILSKDEHDTCPNGHDTVRIGWIMSDDPDRLDKMASIVKSYTNNENDKGGVETVSDTVTKSEESVAASLPASAHEEAAAEAASEAPVVEAGDTATEVNLNEEEAAEAVETPDESDEWDKISKAVTDLESKVDEGLAAQRTTLTEAIERLEKSINDSKEDSVSKLNELDTRYNEVKTSLENISSKFEEVSKSLEVLDGETAIKKSNDLGGSEGTGTSSAGLWNGSIL